MNDFKLRGFWVKLVKNEYMGAGFDQHTIEQYSEEIDDTVSRVEEGQYYTQEEVESMSKIGSE